MLLCCLRPQDVLPQKEEERYEDIAVSVEEGSAEESVSRKNTKRLHANFRLPYEVEEVTMTKNRELDCKTSLGQSGWPDVFEPNDMNCGLCGFELGVSRSHPGSNGNGILITCLNPFRRIQVKVKMCKEKSCQAMHRVVPTEVGMYKCCYSYQLMEANGD